MTKLTLQLPPRLVQALEAVQIGETQAREIALAALELCAQRATGLPPSAASEATQFARRMIEENRTLFDELARR